MFASALAMVRAVRFSRGALVALLAVLLFTSNGGMSAPGNGKFLHPSLFSLATLYPAQRVNVIVQKNTPDDHLEKATAALGGQVTHDLWIINGFAAQMPAGALPQLAGAGGVRWISPDGDVQQTDDGGDSPAIDTSSLANAYIKAIGADQVWNVAPAYLQGQGIGVAIMDSGVSANNDFGPDDAARLVIVSSTGGTSFNDSEQDNQDNYGHGTHVAGIVGGNGANSGGKYVGVAPKSRIFSLKIANKSGVGTASGVLQATQWLLANHTRYNIRVVNMSFSSTFVQSYNVDPLDVAVEALWFSGMVVVVSTGNNGPNSVITAPANDPFAIAVGASDDMGTGSTADDSMAVWSSSGTIENGSTKPDLVAPGRHIISVLSTSYSTLAVNHAGNIVPANNKYFVMSGTSMSAPVVSGAVALLLQSRPTLTPNQVKGCLIANARSPLAGSSAPYLTLQNLGAWDCSRAMANQNAIDSQLLFNISNQLLPGAFNLGNVNWGNVNWGNVNWGNVNWGNVNWGNVNWGNVNWGNVWDN